MQSWLQNTPFTDLAPVWQALIAGTFTWGLTAVGAMLVFFMRSVNRLLLDLMLGFAGGVMLAASFWSLLSPAIAVAEANAALPAYAVAAIGFLAGSGMLLMLDRTLPHLHPTNRSVEQPEGIQTAWRRSALLMMAITLHNIPEGLAVGVAFGGATAGLTDAGGVGGAAVLAMGIGIQNFPEGIAVAMPLRGAGMSRLKAFFYGQASALVEPAAAVLGALAVTFAQPLLPYALAFAAGAMIYVVVEELIPESQAKGNTDWATTALLVGFSVMMVLDVALG